MDPATSAQCVSMTLFSDRSAVVWSCTSVSSSIEMRPAAEERPRAGTMEMGPATAMLEPFSLDPSRYFVHAVCLRALPLWRDLPSRSSAQLPLFCFERSGRSQPCRWPQLVGHSGEMNHPLKKDAMSQKGAYRGSGFPLYIRRLMKVRTSPCTPPTRRTTRPDPHDPTERNDANFIPTPTHSAPAVPSDGPGVHLLADVPAVHEPQGGVQAHDVSQT